MNLKSLIEAIVHTADVGRDGIYITPEVVVKTGDKEYEVRSVWTRGDGKFVIEAKEKR